MINKILLISLSLFVNVCVANEYWTTINTDSNKLRCADGTSYNFHYKKGNENLLIFFNGGGACWDFDSCNSIDKDKYQLNTYEENSNLPYNQPNYWGGLLDFKNNNNNIKDWSVLNLPYCTGDLFLGNKNTIYKKNNKEIQIFHHGKNNLNYALEWLKSNDSRHFQKKLIVGSSAGGYGAILNSNYVNKVIPSNQTYVFFDASDGVVSKTFEDKVFSRNSVWGYKPTSTKRNDYIINRYNQIISSNPHIKYGSFTTSSDIMQILFFNIMNNSPNNWLNISNESIKDWQYKSSENQKFLLNNRNYFTYIQDDCIHSGLRYNDSFYNSDKISFNIWFQDFLNDNNYSKGSEYLFRKTFFTEEERNKCIFRAVNSVKRG